MKEYIKKFWVTILGGFVFGIALAILLDIPWRFTLSLAIFLFILNTIIEQASGYSAVTNLAKKVFAFGMGVVIFVGLRAVAGYLLDQPADQAYKDLTTSNGITGITTRGMTTNVVFEILFLVPGMAIAYLVVKEGRFWKTALVVTCTLLLCWVAWTIKQKAHAEAMKRQAQASVALDARSRNNHAEANEAAAATSFGVAKEQISVWYQWDGTNIAWNQAITNVLLQGQQVLKPRPNEQPVIFEGQAFTEVVLQNTNGSFVGGIKVWVETWKFNWVDGKSANTPTTPTVVSYNINQDEVISALSVPNNSTVYLEADKAFGILERNGTKPDGSEDLSKLTFPPGESQKYFAWGGTIRLVGLYTNTTVTVKIRR